MPVSETVANLIMGQKAPDVYKQYQQGQVYGMTMRDLETKRINEEEDRRRADETRKIQGQILGQQFQQDSQMQALSYANPDAAVQLAKILNIPLDGSERFQMFGENVMFAIEAEKSNPGAAFEQMKNYSQRLAIRGVDAKQTNKWLQEYIQNPEAAITDLAGIGNAFNQVFGKGVDQEKDIRTASMKEFDKSQTDPEFKDFIAKKEPSAKRSPLKILLDERSAVAAANPEGHPSLKMFDRMIEKQVNATSASADPDQVSIMARQVIEGRLNPQMISKRSGLQQAVFAEAERLSPGINLVETQANAIYKTMTGNLQSRGLVEGTYPLYDRLLNVGKELNNSNLKLVNKVVNFAKEQTGDPTIVAFNNLRDDTIAETERILMGSGVLSDSKYLRAVENIHSAQSYEQLEAAITQMKLAVKTRMHALDKAPFKEAGGTGKPADKPKGPAAGKPYWKMVDGKLTKVGG